MKNILLIDSNNLLHRVYWVHKSYAKTASVPHLFLNSIKKYYKMFNPDITYAAWDSKILHGQSNFRKDNHTEYKQTRSRDNDDEIYSYESIIKEACKNLGIHNICPGVLEADDVIYWLSNQFSDDKKTVVSVDKDLFQLVNENTNVFSPIKSILITNDNFEQHNNIPREHFVNLKALVGDKSDNIEGVPKIGEKTGRKLLLEGNVKENLTKENYKLFKKNLNLVDLSKALGFHPNEEDIYKDQLTSFTDSANIDKFRTICEEQGWQIILNSMQDWRSVFFKNDFINRLQSFLDEK